MGRRVHPQLDPGRQLEVGQVEPQADGTRRDDFDAPEPATAFDVEPSALSGTGPDLPSHTDPRALAGRGAQGVLVLQRGAVQRYERDLRERSGIEIEAIG